MPGANQNYGGILSFMNQYNSQSRASRQRKSSSRRHNSEPSQLRTVLLFYVLPFIVVNTIIFFLVTSIPKGTVTVGETADFQSTVVELCLLYTSIRIAVRTEEDNERLLSELKNLEP